MRRIAVVIVVVLAAVVGGEPAAEKRVCELRLRNGSIVRGELQSPREIKLTRKDDVKTLRVEELLQVSIGGAPKGAGGKKRQRREEPAPRDRVVGKSGIFDGQLEPAGPWVIDTGFGVLTVPQSDVRTAGFWGAGAAFLYDFGEVLPTGFDTWGKTRWNASGTALSADPDTSGDALLLPNLLEGDYVLEADVRCDGWAAILFNVQDAQHATALWLTPGTAGIYASPDWKNFAVRTWTVPTREGQTVHARIAVAGSKATITIEGDVLGEVEIPTSGRRFGFGAWSKRVAFDNVRLSR